MFPTTCKLPVISTFEPIAKRSSPSNWSFGYDDNTPDPVVNGILLLFNPDAVMVPVNVGLESVAPVIVDVHSGKLASDFICKTSLADPLSSPAIVSLAFA